MNKNTPSTELTPHPLSSIQPVVERQVALSDPQEMALEWLMNGGTVVDAAQYAGVCRQTIFRWLSSDPDFRAVFDNWREQVTTFTDGQLLGLADSAVATLANATRNRQDVHAAEFLIKHLSGSAKRQ